MRPVWEGIATIALGLAVAQAVCAAGALRQLRFSPDGRHFLAQDASQITVFGVEPLGVLFRAPAANATQAEFTPDSREVVFVSSVSRADSRGLTVVTDPSAAERWSIAGKNPVARTEMRLDGCETVSLSSDGHWLACVDFHGTLRLLDAVSGKTVIEKKKFARRFVSYGKQYVRTRPDGIALPVHANTLSGDPGSARMEFSPDGRFLVAAPLRAQGGPFVYDFHEKTTVALTAGLKGLAGQTPYAFVGSDRLMILRPDSAAGSLVALPSGKALSKPELLEGEIRRAADPAFVILQPRAKGPAVAIEYRTGQVIVGQTEALDVRGNRYVAEREDGQIEIGIYEKGKPRALASVKLAAR